jgi:hypothetical protein
MPMLKTLPQKSKKNKNYEPKDKTLFAILNYSKSLVQLKICEKKQLLNVN